MQVSSADSSTLSDGFTTSDPSGRLSYLSNDGILRATSSSSTDVTPELINTHANFRQSPLSNNDIGNMNCDEGGRQQQQQLHLQHSPKLQFYKTSMCKFYLAGHCVKGGMCTHAHEESELVKKPDVPRTRLCRALLTYGVCNHSQCKYAHDIKEIRQTNTFFKTKMCDFFANGHCKLGNRCRFAHSEEELVGELPPPGTCDGTTPKPLPVTSHEGSISNQHQLNCMAPDFHPGLPLSPTTMDNGVTDLEVDASNRRYYESAQQPSRRLTTSSTSPQGLETSPVHDLTLPLFGGNGSFLTARMVSPDGTPLANGPLMIPTFAQAAAQHQQQSLGNTGSPANYPGPPLPVHLMQSPLNIGSWGAASQGTPTFHIGANRTPTHIHELLRSASIDELKRYANQLYED